MVELADGLDESVPFCFHKQLSVLLLEAVQRRVKLFWAGVVAHTRRSTTWGIAHFAIDVITGFFRKKCFDCWQLDRLNRLQQRASHATCRRDSTARPGNTPGRHFDMTRQFDNCNRRIGDERLDLAEAVCCSARSSARHRNA